MYYNRMAKRASPKSLRLPVHLARSIELEARRAGRSFSAVATEMLEEAARSRRFRHIVFAGPPGRRRASMAGTGVDVWEVVRDFRAVGESMTRLAKAYHWIDREKLEEALAYARAYTQEITERLEREESWTAESVAKAMPWSVVRTRKS